MLTFLCRTTVRTTVNRHLLSRLIVSTLILSTLPAALFIVIVLFPLALRAQQFDPALYQELHWRMIGPFRGGRTVAISGIPEKPNVFYMAPNNGGVWKSTDFGHTWNPIFDDQPNEAQASGSIGALAV